MNREIKFRVWDGDTISYPIELKDFGNPFNLMPDYIVMQYTGLKDKNGVEIYEGDIIAIKFSGRYIERVYWKGDPDAIAEVFWDYTGFRLKAKGKEDDRYADFFDEERPQIVDMSLEHSEVIGNIYENPELLTTNTPQGKEGRS